MMEEPQSGGLIDRYWIFEWIILPIVIILTLVIILFGISHVLNCPYIEDVYSCFPYNLPNWVKLAIPLTNLLVIISLIIIVKRIGGEPK